MKRRRATLMVFYTAALLIVAVVVTEFVIFPLLQPTVPRSIRLMGFYAPPDSMVDDVQINAMGFPGDVVTAAKAPGTTRILTLGGSAFFNRRMTQRLRSGLQNATSDWIQVLGGALRMHTTRSSVLKYQVLRQYDFDYVLIYHGINDLWANHADSSRYSSDYVHLNAWYQRGSWLDRSYVARTIYNKLFYPGHVTFIDTPLVSGGRWMNAADNAADQMFGANLKTLIDQVREDGAVPILMTFAWCMPKDYSLDRYEQKTLGYDNPTNYDSRPAELWGTAEYVRSGIKKYNKVIREIAIKEQVALIDQEVLMGKDPGRYGDVCHFSEKGTDIFIGHVVDFFIQQRLIEPSPDRLQEVE